MVVGGNPEANSVPAHKYSCLYTASGDIKSCLLLRPCRATQQCSWYPQWPGVCTQLCAPGPSGSIGGEYGAPGASQRFMIFAHLPPSAAHASLSLPRPRRCQASSGLMLPWSELQAGHLWKSSHSGTEMSLGGSSLPAPGHHSGFCLIPSVIFGHFVPWGTLSSAAGGTDLYHQWQALFQREPCLWRGRFRDLQGRGIPVGENSERRVRMLCVVAQGWNLKRRGGS